MFLLPLTLSSITSLLLLLVLLGTSGSVCEAAWVQSFGTSKTTTTRQPGVATTTTSRLFSTIDKQGQTNLGDGQRNKKNRDIQIQDLDQARNTLENLVASTHDVHKNRLDDDDHHTVPVTLMTSAGRRRRQLEMDLLRQLAVNTVLETEHVDEDDSSSYEQDISTLEPSVVDELMHLWMYEHGPEPASKLEAMQRECTPGMAVEEQELRDMMDQYPTWAEPRARLSILLFMKGQSEESEELALQALQLKPWHFDVFPVLIMIALRNQDMGEALYWARQGLPSYRPHSVANQRRRIAWVDRALTLASDQWEKAEQETLDRQQEIGTSDSCWQ